MIEVHLVEGARAIAHELPNSVADALRSAGVVTAYPLRPGLWELSDSGKVGVIHLGDVTVWIRPKIAIDRLFWLLGYAKNPGWERSEPVGYERTDHLVPFLAEAFVAQAERALSQGLLKGYEEIEDSSHVLRGRLREHAQLRERYGIAVPLLVRYDDYTVDMAENQLLRGALERLLRLPGVRPSTIARLRRLRRVLYDVTPPVAGKPLPTWQESRLNARYHGSLWLAEIILADNALAYAPGQVRLGGFLVNMAKVYEDFVTVALGLALSGVAGHCRAQDRWYLDEAEDVLMKPDLVWYVNGSPAAVIDAKYKAEKPAGFPDADLYQLFAYATALGLEEGHLVYARGNSVARRWQVRNAGVTITAHTLDLESSPAAILGQVAELARQIAAPAQ